MRAAPQAVPAVVDPVAVRTATQTFGAACVEVVAL